MDYIKLTNYRCYKELDLSFKSKINLLVGDNASGKTTILRALRSVLSTFFTGYSDENTRFFGLSKDDFTIQQTQTGILTESPINIDFRLMGQEASLTLNTLKSRTLQTPLESIFQYSKQLKERQFTDDGRRLMALPLFASFSTEDIHSSRKLDMEPFKRYQHKPSFGYYECLQGEGFLKYWTKRLLVLQEGQKSLVEIECVRLAVQHALGAEGCNIISDIEIRPNQGKVYYHFTDGREVDTDNLSDGYARLVNIVVDLAFRCALLNSGTFGENAYYMTSGTVLIDEIDLHLHPSLQLVILKSLTKTFQGLQFIVTTHAPMVMTGIENDANNVIYKLSYSPLEGYQKSTPDMYGQDASTIIETTLNTTPRSKEVDEELNKLFELIDADDFAEATTLLNSMKERFGDSLNDLAKAEAMLNFLVEEND